ncbi:acyltransferase family protein [Vibrio splendidus]
MQQRLIHIDVLRAIAILLVTGYHIWVALNGSHEVLPSNAEFSLMGVFVNGEIGVELFFLVSGYCMSLGASKNNFKLNFFDYYKKRFLRIAPTYYIAIIFWNIIIYLGFLVKPNDWYHNLMHIFFIHNLTLETFHSVSGVFWSLAVEMQFYFLLPFILPLLRSVKTSIGLFVFVLTMSVFININFPFKLMTWSLLSYLVIFVFGIILGVYKDKFDKMIKWKVVNTFLLIGSFISLCWIGPNSKHNELHQIFTALVIGYLFFINRRYIDKLGHYKLMKFLAYIGLSSYSLYLYNYMAFALIKPMEDFLVLNWLVPFVFVLIFGFLTYEFIELKVTKLLKIKWGKRANCSNP